MTPAMVSSCLIRISWCLVLKAADKSSKIMAAAWPLLPMCRSFLQINKREVSVLLLGLKPDWESCRILCFSICSCSCNTTSFSMTLANVGMMETGQ